MSNDLMENISWLFSIMTKAEVLTLSAVFFSLRPLSQILNPTQYFTAGNIYLDHCEATIARVVVGVCVGYGW